MGSDSKLQIVCGHCGATNRLPESKLGDRPSCGKCKQALFTGEPVELTEESFRSTLAHTDIPVLVDFWAPWCGPCRMMAPVYVQAAARLEPQLRLAKLDTERLPQLAGQLNIRSIPTLALFKGAREIARHSGAVDLRTLTQWVETQIAKAA